MNLKPAFKIPSYGDPMEILEHCPITQGAIGSVVYKVQAPWDMVMMGLTSMYSVCLQAIIDVQRPGLEPSPVSMYTLTIAESGERKSSVWKLLEKPLVEGLEEVVEEYRVALTEYEVELEIIEGEKRYLKRKLSKLLREGKPTEEVKDRLLSLAESKRRKPINPQIILEDTTPEALAFHLYEGFGSAGLMSSEGGTVINGRSFQNVAILNKGWAAEPLTVHRKTSESFTLGSDKRLSIQLQVQPEVARKFMKNRGSESRSMGFLARFLVCYPVSTQGIRDNFRNRINSDTGYLTYIERMSEILEKMKEYFRDPKKRREVVTFSPEAENFWIWISNYVEVELRIGGRFQYAKDLGSKLAEIIARLAALLTYIELGEGNSISLGILQDATRIAFYCSDMFLRSLCVLPDYQIAINDLHEYFVSAREDGLRYLRKNHLLQKGPNKTRKKSELDPALFALQRSRNINLFTWVNGIHVIDLYPGYDWQPDRCAAEIGLSG